jgi:hypothetical protein
MIWSPHPPAPLVESWFQRHPTPLNRVLHVVGVPPTILGFFLIPVWLFLLSIPLFVLALSLFTGGYVLQFLGHALEGSPSGEMTFLKGRLRRSRLGVALRSRTLGWLSKSAPNAAAVQPK